MRTSGSIYEYVYGGRRQQAANDRERRPLSEAQFWPASCPMRGEDIPVDKEMLSVVHHSRVCNAGHRHEGRLRH